MSKQCHMRYAIALKNPVCITFFFLLSFNLFAQKDGLRVLSYNTLYGFDDDKVHLENYLVWVKDLDPDIILYQEMNGYTQNKLTELAQSYGHPYSVMMNHEFGVPNTHPLAITSKWPILNVSRVLDDMWHGYLYAYICGIHVFNTHLAPFTVNDRIKDVKKILAQAQLIPEREKVLIAGDFNALSSRDSSEYGDELLASMRKIEGRFEPKSNTEILRYRTINRNNLIDDQIDYSVVGSVLAAGYTDSFYALNNGFKNSVPTKGHAGPNSKPRRIDYIFLNQALINDLTFADIIQDGVTANISDHYPVFVELKLK